MNILLWLAYKGTNYSGFQVQPNGVTVCAVVQDAMQSVFGTRPDVKGCSRTDAGVHARRFALNFHYDGRIPVQRIPLALNARLPMDVRALAAQQVPDDFHARYAAHAKTYHYRLRCSAVDDPFDYETCHRVNGPLDLAAMQAAAAHFVGRHDFLALCASGSSAAAHGDTVRTITGSHLRAYASTISVILSICSFVMAPDSSSAIFSLESSIRFLLFSIHCALPSANSRILLSAACRGAVISTCASGGLI